MPDLVLGPLLRYLSETEATVWVETSEPCEVRILGRRERTFGVAGSIVRLDKTVAGEEDGEALEKTFERRLT